MTGRDSFDEHVVRSAGMDDVELRILKAAITLAEQGGFENVRQRDLPVAAKVALGTLYARFPSKDLVLVSALRLESESFDRQLKKEPIVGRTPEARLVTFCRRRRWVSRATKFMAWFGRYVNSPAAPTGLSSFL